MQRPKRINRHTMFAIVFWTLIATAIVIIIATTWT